MISRHSPHSSRRWQQQRNKNNTHLFFQLSVNKFKSFLLNFLIKHKRFIVYCWVMDAPRRRLGRIAKLTTTWGIVYWRHQRAQWEYVAGSRYWIWLGDNYVLRGEREHFTHCLPISLFVWKRRQVFFSASTRRVFTWFRPVHMYAMNRFENDNLPDCACLTLTCLPLWAREIINWRHLWISLVWAYIASMFFKVAETQCKMSKSGH